MNRKSRQWLVVVVGVLVLGLAACTAGEKGDTGKVGNVAVTTGTIAGTVRDGSGNALSGVSVQTAPGSTTASTAADGTFTLASVNMGAYSVTASKAAFADYTLANVGVAAGATTNISMVLQAGGSAPGTVSGTVTDSKDIPTALSGVVVSVQGTALTATTASDGTFTVANVPPGPMFLTATSPTTSCAAASAKCYLDTETRDAIFVPAGGTVTGVALILSARPSDLATYVGLGLADSKLGTAASAGCKDCHNTTPLPQTSELQQSAHYRSLTRIARTARFTGPADPGAFDRMLNPTLTTARVVMIPLAGTISADRTLTTVTGAGTAFTSLADGDVLGYTPTGLGWTQIGTIKTSGITDDTHLTLTATATLAPTVATIAGVKYSVVSQSLTFTKMLPQDSTDIVAPAWPGVKATNPRYLPTDPCVYVSTVTACVSTSPGYSSVLGYSDGQVNVYWCNLKGESGYTYDEFVQKFGGNPYSCNDGAFYTPDTFGTGSYTSAYAAPVLPKVPLVHVDVIYGGQGDKDGSGFSHPNMGVFKQRYQGRLADVQAADTWTYDVMTGGAAAGANSGAGTPGGTGQYLDSLTLPIQTLESGDKVFGGYKMNGYHPTENKFPGESWTQRTRTFSHACAGCHNIGMTVTSTVQTVTLPFARDNANSTHTACLAGGAAPQPCMAFNAITGYNFLDENLTCEHCHGPGSEHAGNGGGLGNHIVNPKYLTADMSRQTCGKCHAYDDATNASPAQDYGFEYPWNDTFAAQVGNGDYVPGVYNISQFFDNWDARATDDEAFWDPGATGGTLFGQAHRQQYTMLAQAVHTNNAYEKLTCSSCHDYHTQYLVTAEAISSAGDAFALADAGYSNNVLCLTCHAEYGPFAALVKDDVANIHLAAGGTATKNGTPVAAASTEVLAASQLAVSNAVGAHMFDKVRMPGIYDPANEAIPVGRCTSCHMPKLAKSGGYVTGTNADGNKALIEGDQASHVFEIVYPWQSTAMSRGGPSFQSGYYGQAVSATNVKYDLFGFMPNSCSKCHNTMRKASLLCTDQPSSTVAGVWPTFWPFSEHRLDDFWNLLSGSTSCYTSSAAP